MFLNSLVCSCTGCPEVTGNKFGIELELEGYNVRLQEVPTKGWRRTDDGSLRGESVEYVFTQPKTYEEAQKAVKTLFKKFRDNGVKFNDSIRTSTHVHLNFSDKPMKQAINFFCLFTMLEEILQYYSGEDRKGNLFCISSREASGIIPILEECVCKASLRDFAGDRFKYAACNLSTLYKFGTIEIRTMRGASSEEQVSKWLDILNDLYIFSTEKTISPVELVSNLSLMGSEDFLKTIFQDHNLEEILKTFPTPCVLHHSLMEGARLFQIFAYEFDEDFRSKPDLNALIKHQKNRLPVTIKEGNHRGHIYVIYTPEGRVWRLSPDHGGPWWSHGDRSIDDPRIYWNAEIERFCCLDGEGDEILCNWHTHHVIDDEGPPDHIRNRLGMARIRVGIRENEEDDDEDFENIEVEVPDDDWEI